MKIKYKLYIYFLIILSVACFEIYGRTKMYYKGFIAGKDFVINNTTIQNKQVKYTIYIKDMK